MKENKNFFDFLFLIVFWSIIIFFGTAVFLLPAEEFSEKEKRSLASLPSFSAGSLISGDYFTALGDFYSDQFPLRDSFTSLYALFELSLGKCESNGVMCTKDAVISKPKHSKSEIEAIRGNLEALERMGNVSVYIPPQPSSVFADAMPLFYPEDDTLSQLTADFPITPGLFYATDHHWTTDGAYIAYTQICEEMGIAPYQKDHFTVQTVSEDFYGTAYARACLPKQMVAPDSIELYRYEGDEDVDVFYHETGEHKNGFYRFEALETADKYTVFLGGNYPHVSISSGDKRPTLLLIKDSFANSVIPFLALHFDLEVIDPRYCTRSYLQEQLQRQDIHKTLVLMGTDTLTSKIFLKK